MAIQEKMLKNGQKRFKVRVRDHSGQWYKVMTFKLKRDAERYERELLEKRGLGELSLAKSVRDQSVGDYIHTWAETMRSKVSAGWRKSQDQMLRDYVLPSICSVKLLELRTEDLGRIFKKMEDLGRSAQLKLHVYNLLHQILDDAAHADQLILRNPLSTRFKPSLTISERSHLKPDEARRLLAASRDLDLGPAIWLGLLAALRPSEVQGLRWESVDFTTGLIQIRDAFKRKVGVIEPYPKGKHIGTVPMVAALRDLLKERRQGRGPTDFVVPGSRQPMLSYSSFLYGLRRLCQSHGLTVVTPHELRHSATELWVEQGATEEDIVRLLNHSSAASVRRYLHRSPDRLKKIASVIDISLPTPIPAPKSSSPLRLVR